MYDNLLGITHEVKNVILCGDQVRASVHPFSRPSLYIFPIIKD